MTLASTAARSFIPTSVEQSLFFPWDSPEEFTTNPDLEAGVEIGLRFFATSPGQLVGMRFWIAAEDTTATITVHVWSGAGTALASKAITGFEVGGWVRVYFDAAIDLAQDDTYVISRNIEKVGDRFWTPVRAFAFDRPITVGNITALSNNGLNGVFSLTSGTFPDQPSVPRETYFVDPIFRRMDVVPDSGGNASGFIASVIQGGLSLLNRFSLLAGTILPAIVVDATRHTHRGPTQAPAIDIDVLGAVGAAVLPAHTPGVDVDASLRDIAAMSTPQNLAFAVAQIAETAWTTPTQAPAINTSLLGANGTGANEVHTPAVDVDASVRAVAAANVAQIPSVEMVQITYALTRLVGGNASADVTGTWTNRANAEGIHNASSATSAGGITASSRKMRLDYANHTNKTALTISSVKAFIYASCTTALVGTAVTFTYNVGAGEVNLLAAQTADFNWLTTPQQVDLTSVIGGDWAKLDVLQTFINHAFGTASSLNTVSVDAIELEVVASATQTEGGNP